MDITITAETVGANGKMWRAATNGIEAIGKTAGEALDSLTTQLGKEQDGMFIVYEQWQPDKFFTAAQQQRLSELMARWRAARDVGKGLPADEQAELEALVNAQLEGSAKRAAALRHHLKP